MNRRLCSADRCARAVTTVIGESVMPFGVAINSDRHRPKNSKSVASVAEAIHLVGRAVSLKRCVPLRRSFFSSRVAAATLSDTLVTASRGQSCIHCDRTSHYTR